MTTCVARRSILEHEQTQPTNEGVQPCESRCDTSRRCWVPPLPLLRSAPHQLPQRLLVPPRISRPAPGADPAPSASRPATFRSMTLLRRSVSIRTEATRSCSAAVASTAVVAFTAVAADRTTADSGQSLHAGRLLRRRVELASLDKVNPRTSRRVMFGARLGQVRVEAVVAGHGEVRR
jgi:hypothetical protein